MWNVLKSWLNGSMGTAGSYQYRAIHGYSTLAVMLVLAAVVVLGLKGSPKLRRRLLKGLCWFQLAFEAVWRLIYLFINESDIVTLWPAFPCNLGGILLPVIALCKWDAGRRMFYLFGFVGGVLTFAIPMGIFGRDVLVFPILKSILQHTGLLMIPALEYVSGSFRPRVRDMGWVILGLLIHLFNCEVLTRFFGLTGDYMYLRGTMPFVIPGVPQYITVSVAALLTLTGLSAALAAAARYLPSHQHHNPLSADVQ